MTGLTLSIRKIAVAFCVPFMAWGQTMAPPNFQKLDADASQSISRSEFRSGQGDAFIWADGNADGELNAKEFKRYFFFEKKINSERASIPAGTLQLLDIPYVVDGHQRQKLDLYLPAEKSEEPLPLVIWVHGGAWKRGSKLLIGEQCALLKRGYAVASINYRFTDVGPMPMQLHDCKAAVRFLRKNAAQYGLDPERFGAWGASAGGHLVALLGTTDGVAEMEGTLGVTDASSAIQAMALWFTPTDLIAMSHRPVTAPVKREGAGTPSSPMSMLIGGLIVDHPDWARAASPTTYVTADDTPCFIMHGHADPLVPLDQGILFLDALNRVEVPCELLVLQKTIHGWPKDAAACAPVFDFFEKQFHVEQR